MPRSSRSLKRKPRRNPLTHRPLASSHKRHKANDESHVGSLYASAEDYKSTDTFTDFFVPESGRLIVLENNAEGPAAIVKLKQALLPTTGQKHWNHLPNVTSVYTETATQKTYDVLGLIQTRFDGGNCSAA